MKSPFLLLALVGSLLLSGTRILSAQEEAVAVQAHSSTPDTLRIVFLGDIMMHRAQLRAALRPGADSLRSDSYDLASYFRHIQPYLEAADIAVANLECPIGVAPYTGYPGFSAPEALAIAAQEAGIDVLLNANNHICDKRSRGLNHTHRLLDSLGIHHTGSFRNKEAQLAQSPLILDCKGQRIALVNFTYGTNGIPIPSPWVVNTLDRNEVLADLHRAQQKDADWIIALPHWGEEYRLQPNAVQTEWQEFLYDQGVRIIVGSHPHVVQPVQTDWDGYRRERITWFSLGNAISNMSIENARTGFLAEVCLVRDPLGRLQIAKHRTVWLWCSRAGGFEKNYTILPVEDFKNRRNDFCNPADYDRMMQEYRRLKTYFEQQQSIVYETR